MTATAAATAAATMTMTRTERIIFDNRTALAPLPRRSFILIEHSRINITRASNLFSQLAYGRHNNRRRNCRRLIGARCPLLKGETGRN